jgi:hypothetical protein
MRDVGLESTVWALTSSSPDFEQVWETSTVSQRSEAETNDSG